MGESEQYGPDEQKHPRPGDGNCNGSGNGAGDDDDFDLAFEEPDDAPPRAEIRIWNAELSPWSKLVDETVEAIAKSGRPIFKRDCCLVEPIMQPLPTNDDPQRWVKQCCLRQINANRMIVRLGKIATYFMMQMVGRGKNRHAELVPVQPPKTMVEMLIDNMDWPQLPACTGIVNSPTMRSDGSLLTKHGLDSQTGLYAFWPDELKLPPIQDAPTREDALAALGVLQELISECAFDKKDKALNEAVALAAMFTVVLRGAFALAPLFLFHKPEPGTGGSYLVKIISTIASGREAVPLAMSKDEKEFDKELSAAAVQAKPILNLNNVTFDLESPLLSQMISEGEIDVRPFGKNTETITCNCRSMTIIVNGNNIKIVGELVRRCLTCRLNTYLERPETKDYKHKPLSMIVQNRGKYVAAILTIVRAYRISGKTVACERLNGFEGWSKFVQQPLVWLGLSDPVASQKDARAQDPERSALRARVMALKQYFHKEEKFTARDIYTEIIKTVEETTKTENGNTVTTGNRLPECPELLDAFNYGNGKPMSAKSIGWQLIRDEDRIADGFSLKLFSRGRTNSYYIAPRPDTEEAKAAEKLIAAAATAKASESEFDRKFFTEGPEPLHPCEWCKRKDGEIFVIREKHGGVRGRPLHRACAEAFYDADAF